MRYRLMATYRGVPYEVGLGPTNSEVVLFAACPPPEELGFEPATGHWRKPVIRAEIDTLWESRPVGIFRGEPCMVLDDPGERLHIAYLGTDAERATSLGYWQVDRGVFELLTPREEVAELTEERVEKPLRWGELAEATGPMASYPYGTAPWPTVARHVPVPQPAPDAADDEETDPGAGGPPGDAGAVALPAEGQPAEVLVPEAQPAEVVAAEAQPAEVVAAETQPAEVVAAETQPAEVVAADAPGAGTPAVDAPAAGAGPAGAPAAEITPAEVSPAEVSPAEVSPAEVPPAEVPPTEAAPAGAPVAGSPPAGAPAAGRPAASTRRPKAPVSDTPLGDALLAETQRARRTAAAPLASAPLAAPLADDPMAAHPAAAPLASVPPASLSPETAAVPVPSAVSAPAENGAPAATGSWPAYPSAGTDPYPDAVSAGDALLYPDEDEPPGLPVPPGFYDPPDDALAGMAPMGDLGGRAARRQRVPTREIFCELADLASIPRGAYALETETDGAICLLPTPDGFDVFIAADGARHELRSFAEEEAAYFYLFGVLAADAVRGGTLAPIVTMANPHGGTV
jgi:hypothetical protein